MNTSGCLYNFVSMFLSLFFFDRNVSELVAKHKETELLQMANAIGFQTIITHEASIGTHIVYITIY
jgi:hypothetical protein